MPTPIPTNDSFANFVAKVGLQTGNQASFGTYLTNYTSRNRQLLEQAYRSSWICGKVVDAVAEDMTREGIIVTGDMDPTDMEKMEKNAANLKIWDAAGDLIRWGRLYGGAIAMVMIDGQDPATPLNIDRIPKGSFKGLLVLDRWVAMPALTELVSTPGPNYGDPMYYTVVQGPGLPAMTIHHSRVTRYIGAKLPYYQRIQEMGWGQSELERVWDRVLAFDSTTLGAAQLVYKAHLRVIKMAGLRDALATGGKAMDGIVANMKMIAQFQSNEGITLLDMLDEFEAHSYTFSGLDSVLEQFSQQLSGASGIPITRLFGQSPGGMNATGESDTRNYYDGVKQQQENGLRSGVTLWYSLLHKSEFGTLPDDTFNFTFRSLWLQTPKERAETAKVNTEAITMAADSGLISPQTAAKELRQQSVETGLFTNITDEEIDSLEDVPAPPISELTDIDPLTGAPREVPAPPNEATA